MAAIQTENMLRLAILQLEERQKQETHRLKTAFNEVFQNMRPVNLIRNSVKEMIHSQEKDFGSTIRTAVGMGAGVLAKRLFIGTSPNPVRRLLGNVLQITLSNLLAQRGGLWTMLGRSRETRHEDRAEARKTP